MEAIKKKMAALKIEKENAMDRMETAENQLKDAHLRVDKANEELQGLQKKLELIERELTDSQNELVRTNTALEEKEKTLSNAESEVAAQNRRVQALVEELERSEEKTRIAIDKMEQASAAADENDRMRKMLEHRNLCDMERFREMELQLKDARNTAEDADRKYDEVARKLAMVEDDLERAEERAQTGESKIQELEEELKVVSNNVKSLEVCEEKAIQREDAFDESIKHLIAALKEAENRAEYAERAVVKLQKEVDRLEDEWASEKEKFKAITEEMDQTFAELTGY